MLEWLIAAAILVTFLALLPRLLRRTKSSRRASGGSGVWVGIGMTLAMIFDPKTSQAIEMIDRKSDEQEDEESGDKPWSSPPP